MSVKKEWCEKRAIHLTDLSWHGLFLKNIPKPRRYRCPKCKKRFMTFIKSCGDIDGPACCWHEYLPPHKRVVKTENGGAGAK